MLTLSNLYICGFLCCNLELLFFLLVVLCFVFFSIFFSSDPLLKFARHPCATTTTATATTATATTTATTKHLTLVLVSYVNQHPVERRRGQRDLVHPRVRHQRQERDQQPSQQRRQLAPATTTTTTGEQRSRHSEAIL